MTHIYTVLDKYPHLAEMLEKRDSVPACRELFEKMSDHELAELKTYIAQRFDQVEHGLWKCARESRNITAQEMHMKEDKARISSMLNHLKYQLHTSFRTIYSQPQKAQQKTWESEQQLGLKETSDSLKKRPQRFGLLRGFSILGIKLFGRDTAVAQAKKMDYKSLRLNYSHGQSMLTWLNTMLGEEEKKDAA